jgi:hypothetical protein
MSSRTSTRNPTLSHPDYIPTLSFLFPEIMEHVLRIICCRTCRNFLVPRLAQASSATPVQVDGIFQGRYYQISIQVDIQPDDPQSLVYYGLKQLAAQIPHRLVVHHKSLFFCGLFVGPVGKISPFVADLIQQGPGHPRRAASV